MRYPDFSYYLSTGIVLFFVVCGVTIATYYWGTNLLPYPNPDKVSFRRKIVFSLLVAMVFNVLPIYGATYMDGLLSDVKPNPRYYPMPPMVMGSIFKIVRIINPLSYFVLFYLGVKILLLPVFRSAKTMQLAYVYFVCCHILLRMSCVLFPQNAQDPRGWNFLNDIFMQFCAMSFVYFYLFVKLFYKKSQFQFDDPLSSVFTNVKKSVFTNFIICCAIYMLIFYRLDDRNNSIQYCLVLFLMLSSYLVLVVFWDYHQLQKQNLYNQKAYMTILEESIADFRGIKHDFNNIIQTYSGYLAVNDYEKLEQYHKKVTQTMENSERSLDLSQRLLENPAFFIMLNKIIELGQQKGIQFQVDLHCDMGNVFNGAIHFSQVVQRICELTMQFAMRTLTKGVSISGQAKADGGMLFIFSNRSDQIFMDIKVNTYERLNEILEETMFKKRLHQINEILVGYTNTSFHVYSKGDFLTIYLEVKPTDARYCREGEQK